MDWLGPALTNIFALHNLAYLLAAVAGGILVGALPGLTGTMAIALLVPFTYGLTPETALIILGGVYVGAMYGGSIAAILINTPGAPASIATTFDGYPMAASGRAEQALIASATSSGIGGLLGTIVLLFFSPILAGISLKFGPPEFFWLGVMGLTIIASLSAKSLVKGVLGGLFGVLISTIGLSPSTGVVRLTFGNSYLLGGVEIIIALIGLFCIPQVLSMTEKSGQLKNLDCFKPKTGITVSTMLEVVQRWGNIIRSSVIGVIVGIIPGAGGNVAGLLSYQEAMRASKHKDSFGKGNIGGVIASETANNAEVEGSLIPLLTLGIPGAPQAAVLYGALILQGLRPGAELYTGRGAVITYTFILSLFLANIMMFIIGISASRYYARALKLPNYLLMPIVLSLSVVGTFASRNSVFDVAVMLLLGLIAFAGTKVALSPAPIALGVILGPIIERGLVESIQLSRATGSLAALFFTRPLSLVLIALTLISMGWPLYVKLKEYRKSLPVDRSATRTSDFGETASRPSERQPAGTCNHRQANLYLGFPGLMLAVVAGWQLMEVDLQTAILPACAAAMIALLSIGLLIHGWMLDSPEKPAKADSPPLNHSATRLAVIIAIIYVVLMGVAGFFVTTFAVLFSLGLLLTPEGRKRNQITKILVSAAITCTAFYVVFVMFFNVPFPAGWLY